MRSSRSSRGAGRISSVMKSGRLLMGGPPTSGFFFAAAGTEPEELVQVIGHVAIALALGQDLEIGLDEGDPATEEKGDLSGLHASCGRVGRSAAKVDR